MAISRRKKKKIARRAKADIRPHDWLLPSKGGTTYLPDPLRGELGHPKHIPWIPDANLVVLYNPKISLEEFQLGLEIMITGVRLRHRGKTDDEIAGVLTHLRELLIQRDYRNLAEIIDKMKEENTN